MSNAPTSSTQPRPLGLVEFVARRQQQTVWALYALGVLFALVPIILGIMYRTDYLWICIWGALLALSAWGVAIWQTVRTPGISDLDNSRILLIVFGGLFGLFTTWLGFMLGWEWWSSFVGWVNGESEKTWHIPVVLLVILGGLGIMFASLQIGRSEERTNPTLRVLVYGYNTVLTGVLLLSILTVLNVLVYLKFPAYADFTSESIYTLSPRSKSILQSLDKPTHIYAIFSSGDPIGTEMSTLLTDCRQVNDKIQVTPLSPDLNKIDVIDLARRYAFSERFGVLVLYGSEPQIEHRFIKYSDLYTEKDRGDRGNPDEKPSFSFKGEDALITELSFLEEGQKKPAIYFTQGSGELDLKKTDASRPNQGTGVLKERLEKRNLEVKPLTLAPGDSVPDNAEVVVIAGPANPMSEFALKALREYMNPVDPKKKKGKLFVLIGPEITRDGKMKQSGLEGLLAEFSVQVGNERVLSLVGPQYGSRHPMQVALIANPDLAERNAVAAALGGTPFTLLNVRPVRPVPQAGGPPGANRYSADTLFETLSYAWAESNLRDDPVQIYKELSKDIKKLKEKLSQGNVSVAVAVSEPAPFNQADPHAGMRGGDNKPRLVVFGNSSIAANDEMTSLNFEIVSSCIDWLRDRPSSIGIEPKKREFYRLGPTTTMARLVYLPGLLVGIAIVGLGTGVWIVRRR